MTAEKLHDEFGGMEYSTQVRYQLRHLAKGLCTLCASPLNASRRYCDRHLEAHKVRQAGYRMKQRDKR